MSGIAEKWNEILNTVCTNFQISNASFKTWFSLLEFYDVIDNKIIIKINHENEQTVNYISSNYKECFLFTISEIMNEDYDDLVFVLKKKLKDKAELKSENKLYNISYENANLKPTNTFDSFVVGNNNFIAHAAAMAVSQNPGLEYNPLYICGSSGLGKTHLMQAIGNHILKNDPNKKILYVTSEQFTNDVVELIRNGNADKLREKYRTVEVLMLDDVQFLIGRERTQDEFFYTFNTLYDKDRQIILTSDRKPNELNLDERHVSRFKQGFTAIIEKPDYETRIAILKEKSKMPNFPVIEDEVFNYVANNIDSNIRDLEGALKQLVAYSRINKDKVITLQIAEDALKDIIISKNEKNITPQYVIEVVAEHFQISADLIKSSSRKADVTTARHIFMYLCREMNLLNLVEIGKFVGGRDHSTVISAINKVESEIQTNKEYFDNLNIIKKKLSPN